MNDIDFASLVKRLREVRGTTQEELARELDVTVGMVNGWENGRHRPLKAQRKRLCRLAEANGVEVPHDDTGNGEDER